MHEIHCPLLIHCTDLTCDFNCHAYQTYTSFPLQPNPLPAKTRIPPLVFTTSPFPPKHHQKPPVPVTRLLFCHRFESRSQLLILFPAHILVTRPRDPHQLASS